MGSLVLPSKAPSSPTTIIQSVPTSTVSTVAQTSSTASEETSQSSDVLASEARSESLLRRNRGRLGTILTGFNGVLSDKTSTTQRKTLLGE